MKGWTISKRREHTTKNSILCWCHDVAGSSYISDRRLLISSSSSNESDWIRKKFRMNHQRKKRWCGKETSARFLFDILGHGTPFGYRKGGINRSDLDAFSQMWHFFEWHSSYSFWDNLNFVRKSEKSSWKNWSPPTWTYPWHPAVWDLLPFSLALKFAYFTCLPR